MIRWGRGKPKLTTVRAYRKKLRCAAGPGHRKAGRKRWSYLQATYFKTRKRKLAERREQRRIDALTPYGKWAIPPYVVECESGGSWSAYNPSGAAGPYQIMPEHGRPWPIRSAADKLAHHRIAAELWAGGAGASNWVCA